MRSICLLGVQVAVEGKGWIVRFTGAMDVLQNAVVRRPISA